jgi:hypothetical protein
VTNPWELLREARTHIVEVAVQGCDDRLLDRIDAALKAHDAVAVWEPTATYQKTHAERCVKDGFTLMVSYYRKGSKRWFWWVNGLDNTPVANGYSTSIDKAKAAALKARELR